MITALFITDFLYLVINKKMLIISPIILFLIKDTNVIAVINNIGIKKNIKNKKESEPKS